MNKYILKAILFTVAMFMFAACEQQVGDDPIGVQKKSLTANPFEDVGKEHNEQLDDFAHYLNGTLNFSTQDVYDFDVKEGRIDPNLCSFAQFETSMDMIDSVAYDFLFVDPSALQKITNNGVINYYMLEFRKLMLTAIQSDQPMSPIDFAKHIETLEKDALSHYNIATDTTEHNSYAAALSLLSLAKYSYEHWYSAIYDETNTWHAIVKDRMNSDAAKAKKPTGFLERVKNGFNAVVATVAAAGADVVGFVEGVVETMKPDVGTTANTMYAGGKADFSGAIDRGAESSKNTFHDIRN